MKDYYYIFLLTSMLLSCLTSGPANPKKWAEKFLRDNGYSEPVIKDVINGTKIKHVDFIDLQKISNKDVKHVIATNAFLTEEEMLYFAQDENDFVRAGLALNKSLPRHLMTTLSNDKSHLVYASLAMNPSVPKELLLQIHKNRNPGLLWFAMNPNCPPSIKDEILSSGDELAKEWLHITESQSRNEGGGKGVGDGSP